MVKSGITDIYNVYNFQVW